MRLADYTDYTMRVLMFCAEHPARRVTIGELAERHGISRNHLMKIVTDLGRQRVLHTTRGRGGGLRLARPPGEIDLADVIRGAETDFRLVECFDPRSSRCVLQPSCRLKGLLETALQAYFSVFEGKTLADLVELERPTPGPRSGARPALAVVRAPAKPRRAAAPGKRADA